MDRARNLAIVAALLAVPGCVPDGPQQQTPQAEGGGPTAPEPELSSAALVLIDRLSEGGHRISMTGDRVTAPESFVSLVAMGRAAVPTLLHVAETTDDGWTRDVLIEIAGRIGDPRARPLLVRFLRARRSNTVSAAIGALGRLGDAEAIPALRQLLDRGGAASEGSFRRLQVLEAMYQCGDESVLADVLAIGLAGQRRSYVASYAAQILSRHPPLREALGFVEPYRDSAESIDEALFFPAAEEWYREAVLGEPSRRRAELQVEFSEPYRKEKRAAWDALLRACEAGNSRWSNVRASASDATLELAEGVPPLTIISGSGHGQSLDVVAWRAEERGRVRGHRFTLRRGPPHSAFPGDWGDVAYSTIALDGSDFAGLMAGLRTILGAHLARWWSGPGRGRTMSSGHFVVSIDGPGSGSAPVRFCGSPTSENRIDHVAPRAACEWMRRYLAERPPFSPARPTAAAKRVFSAIFRREQPHWGGRKSEWGWVRARMVTLAGPFGDDTLQGPLETYLAPESAGKSRVPRTAAKACSALAAILGEDLRFGPDGSPRDVREVATMYRALLERQ